MIANILNTLLGIALVYVAVLNPGLAGGFRNVDLVAGALIVILSQLSRRTDYHPWHSSVTTFLGLVILAAGAWNVLVPVPAIVNYWIAFWTGVLTSFIALWAALYRPAAARAASPANQRTTHPI